MICIIKTQRDEDEYENLIKINKEQSSTLQTLENNFIQMKEASLISDLMYEFYSQFILRYEDDEIIQNIFIEYKTIKLNNKRFIADINTDFFHRLLNGDGDEELSNYVKEKFLKAVNSPNDDKFSYDNNTKRYNELFTWRHSIHPFSSIRNFSKYKDKNNFIKHVQEEIEKLTDPRNNQFGREILEQIQNLFKVK